MPEGTSVESHSAGAETPIRSKSDEEACGKLWEVYVKEAKQYDDGLVKSWKEDMDNILVFSALYSAILTAFIIESYQNLQADPQESTEILLKRISEQISGGLDSGNLTPIPDDATFRPTPSALACNILWFISLVLALSSAFLATLIQQWARRFLHRTSVVRSIGAQTSLIQYLYFGLKDFSMHTIVDVIPSLLHLSFFTFLSGLIAFLNDVNRVLTWLLTTVLVLSLAVYSTFTIFPIIRHNSPYATPLSALIWRIWPILQDKENGTHTPTDLEAQKLPQQRSSHSRDRTLVHATMFASQNRKQDIESSCVLWTLQSLNDHGELLPFIEALPDVILNGKEIRESNRYLIKPILESTDPHTDIILRIHELYFASNSSWYKEDHRNRCLTACSKTLYALSFLLAQHSDKFSLPSHQSRTTWFPKETIHALQYLDFKEGTSAARLAGTLATLLHCQSARKQALVLDGPNARQLCTQLSRYCGALVELNEWTDDDIPSSVNAAIDEIAVNRLFWCLYYCLSESHFKNYLDYSEAVCNLVIGSLADRKAPRKHVYPSILLDRLHDQLDQTQDTDLETCDAGINTIFRFAVQHSGNRHLGEISRFISRRVDQGGWGVTEIYWRDEAALTCMIDVAKNCKPDELISQHAVLLQELVLAAPSIHSRKAMFSFLSGIQRNIIPGSYLSFLFGLSGLSCRYGGSDNIRHIIEYSLSTLDSDPKIQELRDVDHKWKILVQCLNAKMPISQTRVVLQFWLNSSGYGSDAESSPQLLSTLVEHTKELNRLFFASDRPSVDLLDINTVMWKIWRWGLPDWEWWIDDSVWTIERLNCYASLLRLSDSLITEKCRDMVETVLNGSTKRQKHTIVELRSWDGEKEHFNLVEVVEASRILIKKPLPLLIPLPPEDNTERVWFQEPGTSDTDISMTPAGGSG